MPWKPWIRRFAGAAVAAYFLHWGAWALVLEAETVIMSALTRTLNWIADHSLGASHHIETVSWSARLVAADACVWGLIPIVLGLVIGWWVVQRKRSVQTPV